MKPLHKTIKFAAILLFWLLIWEGLSLLTGRELLLPSPGIVLKRLAALCITPEFWRITGVTLIRILCGTVSAALSGVILAAATSRFSVLDALFRPLLTIIRATPVASFILLLLVWLGRDILPAVIVFLMVLPVVWENVAAGIRQTDRAFLELGRVYHFSLWKTVRLIYTPCTAPYFLSACRTSLGLAWKAGVAAEVLTVPALSIGRRLYESKLYLETADLFAWTVVVILCSLIIEKLLAAALTRLSLRFETGGTAHDNP